VERDEELHVNRLDPIVSEEKIAAIKQLPRRNNYFLLKFE